MRQDEYDLSVVIPARNEEFLHLTVEDILRNRRGKTQVIVGLDGQPALTPLPESPDVAVLFYPEPIGQRAITNRCVDTSRARYIMKCDAHCAFDEGFDVKMMALMEDDYTMVPIMRNLHVFDWVCPEGHRRYQSRSGPCGRCGNPMTKEIVWVAKTNPQSVAYRFDRTMHFQYWNEWGKKQKGDLTETLSIQGSCFMVTRAKYEELDLCCEHDFSSWGQQGVEVACKTWLSGGRVVVNRTTWYAHMFRTQGGDFGFPYPLSGKEVERNREKSRDLFINDKWPKAKRQFMWLIAKFNPPGWRDLPKTMPRKGILYYTDNELDARIAKLVRDNIAQAGLPITSVSLQPLDFGRNICLTGHQRGYATLFRQILAGLEAMTEDVVYFCEHDILYHPDHFAFTPPNPDVFYYNGNFWFVRLKDGFAVHYNVSPLGGLVAYRDALVTHFRERMELIEREGFSRRIGFEPFTHKRIAWNTWYDYEIFTPPNPNIDLSHGANLTWKRFRIEDFRRKPKFWVEGDYKNIKGWDLLPDLLSPLIKDGG